MSDSEEGPSTGRKTGDTDPPAFPSLSGKDLENLADLVVQKLQKRPTKDADAEHCDLVDSSGPVVSNQVVREATIAILILMTNSLPIQPSRNRFQKEN